MISGVNATRQRHMLLALLALAWLTTACTETEPTAQTMLLKAPAVSPFFDSVPGQTGEFVVLAYSGNREPDEVLAAYNENPMRRDYDGPRPFHLSFDSVTCSNGQETNALALPPGTTLTYTEREFGYKGNFATEIVGANQVVADCSGSE